MGNDSKETPQDPLDYAVEAFERYIEVVIQIKQNPKIRKDHADEYFFLLQDAKRAVPRERGAEYEARTEKKKNELEEKYGVRI